ncbi:unnamed protein product [Somion occarium]|uniref:Transcription factor n=1 Tax=Somion occarium TaxID=3059160 RepID=A0ABP1CV76_9APHY
MAKAVDAPTWEISETSSIGETAVSVEQCATDKHNTAYYKTYLPPKESSRFSFAQKPVPRSTANEVFKWPPPPSLSPPFHFDPFADSEELAVTPTHSVPTLYKPKYTVYASPPRRHEWVSLTLVDSTYTGIGTCRLARKTVAYPSAVAHPQITQREPSSPKRPTPLSSLAHSATPAGAQSSVDATPSLYDDGDDDDFIPNMLRLPWLEYNLTDIGEFTPPSTPSSTPPLSPSTLADDDGDDGPVLKKGEGSRGWQEACPTAHDFISLTGW